ncbi:PIG-L family deacetylase [Sphingobacterium bovistauri]|uniref:PIG-L family deacetylase n=1 Tax=Sphingobacterium bovistauri TaxID=2781959 RepID=A0ABS7ZAR6_9SPHI|nr:PIG-L family deacetylase [Sphingobacterium bovistauri]MCA5006677.1 PIG-L family deacetylase [Sphingobacterium bovistauri]
MRNFSNYIFLICCLLLCWQKAKSQTNTKSISDILIGLQKLDKVGSVLYFAAHPDDENTRLISWLAQEQKYRTAYLSLTRGDGGQNLLGTDLGINLGLIRTQELLAARAIDKGEQLFSSAYDFGFSKTHEETFQFWDHETALREAVWIIRQFQPDVIITRFPPDKRGGHGHHQASAILAHEAFLAAADKTKFPEQLKTVSTWQAKRLLWNTANFGGHNNTSDSQLKIEIGHYNALLGESYGEIAAKSRSQHKTQGFGAAASRGTTTEYFEHVAGSKAEKTLFDDVETSWNRLPNTQNFQKLIAKLNAEFQAVQPQKSVNDLIQLKKALDTYKINNAHPQAANHAYWIAQKKKEVQDLIVACTGIWADAYTNQSQHVVNNEFIFQAEAIVRNPEVQAELIRVNDQNIQHNLPTNNLWKGSAATKVTNTSQPYWLIEPNTLGKFTVPIESVGNPTNPEHAKATFVFNINGEPISITREIQHRFVDPVKGEVHNPLVVLPELTVEANSSILLSKNQEEKSIEVIFTRHDKSKTIFEVNIPPLEGWEVSENKLILNFVDENSLVRTLTLKPTSANAKKALLRFNYNGETLRQIKTLEYDHIPTITWFPTTEISCQSLQFNNEVKNVGYLAGAGDLVGESLQQIGIKTTTLSDQDLSAVSLQQYDAIIIGVRYFNVVQNGGNTHKKLMDYVQNGGVVLVQYNVNSKLSTDKLGPYNFSLGRSRVTEEDSKFSFDEKDIAFSYPNKITNKDFDGWVQERGLYFAENIDSSYRTPLRLNDKNEQPHNGALLIAKHGKGKFVYTSLAFFRQLPAGVPGAYRLFVNLLTNEK